MEFKAGNLFARQEVLSSLFAFKMPVKSLYRLRKIARKVNEELKEFTDMRLELIKEFGEAGENGTISVDFETENGKKFIAKYEEIANEDVSVEIEFLDSIESLGDNVQLTAMELAMLEGLIVSLEEIDEEEAAAEEVAEETN